MKLTIIAGQASGLMKCLIGMGLINLHGVNFVRQPFRVKGVWRCEVML